jgi:hypothetical protein
MVFLVHFIHVHCGSYEFHVIDCPISIDISLDEDKIRITDFKDEKHDTIQDGIQSEKECGFQVSPHPVIGELHTEQESILV